MYQGTRRLETAAPAGTPGVPETNDLKDVQSSDAAAAEIAEINEAGSQTISIRLKDLLDSGIRTFNIPVYGGDIVSVPLSGNCLRRGCHPKSWRIRIWESCGEQVTALKVVALAHGLTGHRQIKRRSNRSQESGHRTDPVKYR